MQVVLEFPSVFWDDSVDYFGAAGEPTEAERGRCFMWWVSLWFGEGGG